MNLPWLQEDWWGITEYGLEWMAGLAKIIPVLVGLMALDPALRWIRKALGAS